MSAISKLDATNLAIGNYRTLQQVEQNPALQLRVDAEGKIYTEEKTADVAQLILSQEETTSLKKAKIRAEVWGHLFPEMQRFQTKELLEEGDFRQIQSLLAEIRTFREENSFVAEQLANHLTHLENGLQDLLQQCPEPSSEEIPTNAQPLKDEEEQREIVRLLPELSEAKEKPAETLEEAQARIMEEIEKLHKQDPAFGRRVEQLLRGEPAANSQTSALDFTSLKTLVLAPFYGAKKLCEITSPFLMSESAANSQASGSELADTLWTASALGLTTLLGTGKAIETLVLAPFYGAKKFCEITSPYLGDPTGVGHLCQAVRELWKDKIYRANNPIFPEARAGEAYTGPEHMTKQRAAKQKTLYDRNNKAEFTVNYPEREIKTTLEGVVYDRVAFGDRLVAARHELYLAFCNLGLSSTAAGLLTVYVLGKTGQYPLLTPASHVVGVTGSAAFWMAKAATYGSLFALYATVRGVYTHPYEALVGMQAFALLAFSVQSAKNYAETNGSIKAAAWMTAGLASTVAIPALNVLNTAIYNYPAETLLYSIFA